jgi:hypothetical protein
VSEERTVQSLDTMSDLVNQFGGKVRAGLVPGPNLNGWVEEMLHIVPKMVRAMQNSIKVLKEAQNEASENAKAAEKERLDLKRERDLIVKQLVEMKQARKAYGMETPEQDPISVSLKAFMSFATY